MLIRALNGTLEEIGYNARKTGNIQDALTQLLRIHSIHRIVRFAMLNEERICEEDSTYVVDWGSGIVFKPDANTLFDLISTIKQILKKKSQHN